MADAYVGRKAKSLEISPQFEAYSRVIVYTGEEDENGDEICYIAGDDTGRTLEVTNPWGSQTVADNILEEIQGWTYKPYKADGARIFPNIELGDSVSVSDIYSGIYGKEVSFSRLYKANIQAPYDEEVDHEFTYESQQDRKYIRKFNEVSATLLFQADQIAAKVEKTGGQSSSFGWTLTDSSWSLYSNGTRVFKADSTGIHIAGGGTFTGTVSASTISGSTITGGSININDKFVVDSSGNLRATSGSFSGNVYAGNIQYGGSAGYFSGGGLVGGSVSTGQLSGGVNTSLGRADFSDDVFHNRDTAPYVKAGAIFAKAIQASDTIEIAEVPVATEMHYHTFTEHGGRIYISQATKSQGSFDIAATQTYKDGVAAVTITSTTQQSSTYQSAYKRYAVSVKTTASNGNSSTTTINVNATAAYNAGYSDGEGSVSQRSVSSIQYSSGYGSRSLCRAVYNDGTYSGWMWSDEV